MRILSYRGPSAPGGVSSALTQVFEQYEPSEDWWFVRDDALHWKQGRLDEISYPLDADIRRKHYRYCNNFLWPVLHDLPQYAHYADEERQSYKTFNAAIAFRLKGKEKVNHDSCFVNDYQFALIPNLLKHSVDTFVFWHIPWPKNVLPEHAHAMAELAAGLLHARVVGFHTSEYLENFFHFVEEYLPHFDVHPRERTITVPEQVTRGSHKTRFLVAPLGINAARWYDMARLGSLTQESPWPRGLPCVLSIDRADYTKGVRERIDAIDCFFSKHSEWQGKVSFLQLGTRSRQGLQEFDRYWNECQHLCAALNSRLGSKNWQPLVWTETPRSAAELASMYRRAAVMLVSPLRDGLNLTAKEYVACQNSHPGVLALSQGAGVWTELGRDCVPIEPNDPTAFAQSIVECLRMDESEKLRRAQSLRERLSSNSLSTWWQTFRQACRSTQTQESLEKVCS